MKLLIVIVLSITSCVHVIAAQMQGADYEPQECNTPPPGVENPTDCCQSPPPLFPQYFEECGYGSPYPKGAPKDPCEMQHCVLNKHKLMTNGKLDNYKLLHMLKMHVESFREAAGTIDKIQEKCIGRPLPGPDVLCEEEKLLFCLSTVHFFNCPKWSPSPQCRIVLDHVNKCKPYTERKNFL